MVPYLRQNSRFAITETTVADCWCMDVEVRVLILELELATMTATPMLEELGPRRGVLWILVRVNSHFFWFFVFRTENCVRFVNPTCFSVQRGQYLEVYVIYLKHVHAADSLAGDSPGICVAPSNFLTLVDSGTNCGIPSKHRAFIPILPNPTQQRMAPQAEQKCHTTCLLFHTYFDVPSSEPLVQLNGLSVSLLIL